MSIIVSVFGANQTSDEYLAALKLKSIIETTSPKGAMGEVVIYSSATLYGQEVKDVDIILMGTITNCSVKLNFNDKEGNSIFDFVNIKGFCTTIEIKSHISSGIKRIGTDFYVKYGENWHCVTEQSNMQKIALMNFFKTTFSCSPYITNTIWFTQLQKEGLNELLKMGNDKIQANVFCSDFNFTDLMQLLVLQQKPFKTKTGYCFDSSFEMGMDAYRKVLEKFFAIKTCMGELTRKRVEEISNKSLSSLAVSDGSNLFIYRGRAGTGKTVGLMQIAKKLVDDEDARVLILTYNKALVSDIRRLFTLSDFSDLYSPSCLSISTMQSYFYRVINSALYENEMEGKYFLDEYERLLQELETFLKDDDSKNIISEICKNDCKLNWDYILVDEAQDWSELEKSVLLNLYPVEKVIVADGGQQFVRNIDVCDWNTVRNRKNIKLKTCLRQKPNLVNFVNCFSEKLSGYSNPIIPYDKLVGGKVVVLQSNVKLFDYYSKEIAQLKANGNIAYDLLTFVPHSMVENNDDNHYFKYTDDFEKHNVFFWDGTNENQRDDFTIQSDEIRMLQYESARGLEGWTVFCINFDEFIETKIETYCDKGSVSPLLLESEDDRKNKYILNWAQIPLTRAIDTIVITLKDQNSNVGKILKEISNDHPDFVTWVD